MGGRESEWSEAADAGLVQPAITVPPGGDVDPGSTTQTVEQLTGSVFHFIGKQEPFHVTDEPRLADL